VRTSSTREFIKKIPIPNQPIDYRDTRLKGLLLRALPSGVKSWYCEYARGKRIWLGRVDAVGHLEAFEAAQKILSESNRGIDPIEARKPKVEPPKLGEFLDDDYGTWARANQRAHQQNLARLKTAFKSLLNKRMDEISALDVERWRGKEVDCGLSHETISRDVNSDHESGGRRFEPFRAHQLPLKERNRLQFRRYWRLLNVTSLSQCLSNWQQANRSIPRHAPAACSLLGTLRGLGVSATVGYA
jgi:hypothetical protein